MDEVKISKFTEDNLVEVFSATNDMTKDKIVVSHYKKLRDYKGGYDVLIIGDGRVLVQMDSLMKNFIHLFSDDTYTRKK